MADRKPDRKPDSPADHRADTFLREVDEELRREQLQQLWEKYGTYMIAAAALFVLGVGGYHWSQSRTLAARDSAGARFEAAQKLTADAKPEDIANTFAPLVKDAPAGYQTLARFQVAGAHARAGKAEAAVAEYETIAKDSRADPILREFATLQAAMLKLDTADWTEMQNRLTPLLNDKSSWRGMARETLGLAAYKAGKPEEARKLFEDLLGDKSAPPTVSERAMLMLSLLTDHDAGKAGAAPAGQPAGQSKEPQKSGSAPAEKAPAGQKK